MTKNKRTSSKLKAFVLQRTIVKMKSQSTEQDKMFVNHVI